MASVNLIFDVDGTLFDSYPSIMDRTLRVLSSVNFNINQDEAYASIIKTSVKDFLFEVGNRFGMSGEALNEAYLKESEDYSKIILYPDVGETLKALFDKGAKLYIYTHRGVSAVPLLKKLGIYGYFIEVVDATKPFRRKPEPDALLYLIRKYGMDVAKTYYVGDRKLDIDCAKKANMQSILFESATAPIGDCAPTYKIQRFKDILMLPL